jgi:hypothetical protein
MGFLDRARNLLTGRGWSDTPATTPEPQAPEPQAPQRQEVQEAPRQRGFLDRLRDPFGVGARREQERLEQERQQLERDRQELERQRAELQQERQRLDQERQRQQDQERQAIERERAELQKERERLEQERQRQQEQERLRLEQERQRDLDRQREQERQRAEEERQRQQDQERQRLIDHQRDQDRQRQEREQKAVEDWKKLGIPDVTGGKGWTIYGCRTPEELRQRLDEAAAAGKRVSLKVHDKNGWHSLYTNPGRGKVDKSGMTVSGGAGISASELKDRFDLVGIPGEGATSRTGSGGIVPEGAGDMDLGECMGPDEGEEGEEGEILDGPEWDYDGEGDYGPDDYYDYVDVSDGGDDSDTEGYDPGSVNGYQLVVY